MIHKMELKHLDDSVDIHMSSFPDFFLKTLGRSFLKVMYKGYITDPNGIALVYIDPETNKAVATAVGIVNPSEFYKRQLFTSGYQYALAALPAVIKNPRIFVRVLRAVTKSAIVPKEKHIAEWSSMAVIPQFRRRGIAKQLTDAIKDEARKRNVTYLYGWTDEFGNDPINKHHKQSGARYIKQFTTPEGRVMNIIRYDL